MQSFGETYSRHNAHWRCPSKCIGWDSRRIDPWFPVNVIPPTKQISIDTLSMTTVNSTDTSGADVVVNLTDGLEGAQRKP